MPLPKLDTRGHAGQMELVRQLSEELRALQEAGELPRTMTARASRRSTRHDRE